MEPKFFLLASQLGESRLKKDIDISGELYTHLGGVVGAFYIATSVDELIRVIELCRELKIKFLVVGLGSKTALKDKNEDLLVIKNRADSLRIFGIKGKVSKEGLGVEEALIEAQSGTSLKRLADYAKKQGLGGLEELERGLGTVGGSFAINPIIREKCYGLKVLGENGQIRESKGTEGIKKEDIILAVVFKLKAAGRVN